MSTAEAQRFLSLDIHKAYFVATGVNREKETVSGPERVPNSRLEHGQSGWSHHQMPLSWK